mgnify:CR=1 FL=1|tara:strand:+ start:17333 stop:17716 length:384 start_codon:yes stop_codon:yes gene_type:complete
MEGKTFSERNPVRRIAGAPLGTLRERLAARGRLDDFERRLADRRIERFRNPQIETDDTYRARQRLNAQRVINQYFGAVMPPSTLTGFLHHNPTVEALGGKIGMSIAKPIADAIDTDEEVKNTIPEVD